MISLQEFQKLLRQGSVPTKVVAYHCGAPLKGDRFSPDYIGSGEGLAALGPGVYFATNRNIAQRYCKYVSDPWLYTVEIQTSGLFRVGSLGGGQDALIARVRAAELDLVKAGHETSPWRPDELRDGSRLKHGPWYIGRFVKALGPRKARELLVSLGVTGAVEKLPAGYEIAVYDTSIIKLTQKESLG